MRHKATCGGRSCALTAQLEWTHKRIVTSAVVLLKGLFLANPEISADAQFMDASWLICSSREAKIRRMGSAVIVPTLNAEADWPRFAPALLANIAPERVLIVDSQSTDATAELAKRAGFRIHSIARCEFNHGGTRQLAAEMLSDADLLIYLTQDAILADAGAIAALTAVFEDPLIMAAYGRQLPRPDAGAIERHGRHFNYPDTPQRRTLESSRHLGFKAIFISNSFAAYRKSALLAVGGFPANVIFGEDTVTAARLLIAGHHIAYVPQACVYHSHDYTWQQEFQRYFDIGVLHGNEHWLLETFGAATGEGKRFFLSELQYLLHHDPFRIPSALLRTFGKLSGYRMGRLEKKLPVNVKKHLSMHRHYWTSKP
jgi:rhamnosyltransferase